MWLVSLLFVGGTELAAAGELNFSPDRPGIGDSTSTVGAGHAMFEGGLVGAFGGGASGFGTTGPIVRLGLTDRVEARVRVPDLQFSQGETAIGSLGIGAKVGGSLGERWSLSVVPELFVTPPADAPGGSLGLNAAWGLNALSAWGHGTVAAQAGAPVASVLGGGASVGGSQGGVLAHSGVSVAGSEVAPMVGIGGWLAPTGAFQLDAGVDVYPAGAATQLVPMLGAVGGF